MNLSIYGAGHMTEALLRGLRFAGSPNAAVVRLYNRSRPRAEALQAAYPHLALVECPADLAASASLVFVIIPPAAVLTLDADLVRAARASGSVLVSCANGLPLHILEGLFPGSKWLRLLPNINWQIGQGVSLWQPGRWVSAAEQTALAALLSSISYLHRVADDSSFDTLGQLTSCGPGLFAALFQQVALVYGLDTSAEHECLLRAAAGTLQYQLYSGKQAAEVVREVANPGGLTAVGVEALGAELPPALRAVKARMDEKTTTRRTALLVAAPSLL